MCRSIMIVANNHATAKCIAVDFPATPSFSMRISHSTKKRNQTIHSTIIRTIFTWSSKDSSRHECLLRMVDEELLLEDRYDKRSEDHQEDACHYFDPVAMNNRRWQIEQANQNRKTSKNPRDNHLRLLCATRLRRSNSARHVQINKVLVAITSNNTSAELNLPTSITSS